MPDPSMEPSTGELYPGRTKYDRARAETYSRRNPRRNREEARVLAGILDGLPSGASALDIPCGAGRIAPLLLERGHRVVCADLSADMIAKALESLGGRARFLRADLLRLPLAPKSFDLAFSIRLFHHLGDPGVRMAMLRELGRVARGKVVITFFHPVSFHNLQRWVERILLGRRSPRVCFTARTLAREAAAAGLRLECTRAVRAYAKDLWFAVLAPAAG